MPGRTEPPRPACCHCRPARTRESGGRRAEVCARPPPLPGHLPVALETFLPPAPRVPRWPASRPRVSGVRGRGNASPLPLVSASLGGSWTLGLPLPPPLPTPSGHVQHRGQPGRDSALLGEGRQVPWVQEVGFRGEGRRLFFRHSPGTSDRGPHRRKDRCDGAVAAAGSRWEFKLDSVVKPGRLGEQEWGERVFSL